ncbi:Molybdenum cofactor sulfurase 3, partial [Gryllus bimaculatus]
MLGDNARVNTTIVVSTAAALVAAAVVTTWWQRRRRESGRMPTKWRRVGELAELRIYPLKSGASLTLKEAECTDIGVRTTGDEAVKLRDRFFIVINEAGVMKTCRQHPKLFFIKVASGEAGTVIFRAPDMKDLTVRIPSGTPERKNYFEMWKEEKSESVDCGDEAAEWMHKFLNLKEDDKVRLGYHQEDVIPRRDCDKKPWSLFRKQYNRLMRYDTQVAPSWFRPNFVVRGASPLAEDDWNYIKIGDNAVFQNFKPCLRCVVTTMDPETAVKDPQMQPLKTLRGYRLLKDAKKQQLEGELAPAMGCYMGLRQSGTVRVGDPIYRTMLGDNARVNTTVVVSTAAALVAAAVVTTWWQRRRRESERMPTKWRRVGELAELRIYPLKSGAALTLKEAECIDTGVRTIGEEAVKLRDRMWMNEKTESVDCGDEAAEWMHKFLNLKEDDKGAFSDLAPFMLINEASVSDLNARIPSGKQVAPSWFRPNFVVRGASPLAEDDWNYIKIGDNAVFQNFKPCLRCVVTTMDPETAEKDPQMQPLKTLRGYRLLKDAKKQQLEGELAPAMGCYMGLRQSGTVRVGDPVYCCFIVMVFFYNSKVGYFVFQTVFVLVCFQSFEEVTLWNGDSIYVMDFGEAAAQWISQYLGLQGSKGRIHFGYFCPKYCQGRNFGTPLQHLKVDYPNISKRDFGVYCDFAPYTLITESSVKALKNELGRDGELLGPDWFRPNFIVGGSQEFEEDTWNYVKIGSAIFQNVMPCHRDLSCCIDPNTGIKSPKGEPFKTLV